MHRSRYPLALFALLAVAIPSRPSLAAWPHEPYNGNLLVSGAPNAQANPSVVGDGAGGVIVDWEDVRNLTDYDIYAQRVSASGSPLWTPDGVAMCMAAGFQRSKKIVSDGDGGAIMFWFDLRGTTRPDIYSQRVNAAGAPQWTPDGVAVCTAPGNQGRTAIVSDNAGGAFLVWSDGRNGVTDIYAQRLNASGVPQWTGDGVVLCSAARQQDSPAIIPDGAGGAIVAWADTRSGVNDLGPADIYAQRVDAAGVAQWAPNGVALCTAAESQTVPAIVSDGAGGAIVVWQDSRSAPGANDIYAQRVSATGAIQWTPDGLALCTAGQAQLFPLIVPDGAGGAIVTWEDARNGTDFDIYAQRVSAAGATLWTPSGVALCTATGDQGPPAIVEDNSGGATLAWEDLRGGATSDLYAQRVNALGAAQWTPDGVAVCTSPNDQSAPAIIADGAEGLIVAWADRRSGTNSDVYAQRIDRYGMLGNPEPAISSVQDVPNDQGGRVTVSWSASYLDVGPTNGVHDYVVWRSVLPSARASRGLPAATRDADEALANHHLWIRSHANADYLWEAVGTLPASQLPGYDLPVDTPADSTGGSNPQTLFMVEARSAEAPEAPHWFSTADSGYSVDNLPPASPASFTGEYSAGIATLHWDRNAELDLAGYRLYRDGSLSFVPGPGNLVSAPADTGYVDNAGTPYVYKLTAMDTHGNESAAATLDLSGTTGVDAAAPNALSLAAPGPNPALGSTTLSWTLSRSGHVRLSVFDVAGRPTRVLVDGALPAGAHHQRFVLRDDTGRDLPSGLYLVRLEAENRVITRRLVTIR